jgi:hypothetical protein
LSVPRLCASRRSGLCLPRGAYEFADESACVTADSVRNEVVTIHRSQEALKLLSLYTYISFAINCFVKNTRTTILALKHTRHQLSLDGTGLRELDVDSVNSSSDYFAYLCIPASETTLHQKRISIVNRSRLRRQSVKTKCKNEQRYLDREAARRGLLLFYRF